MNKKLLIGIILVVVAVVFGIGFYWLTQKPPEKYTGPVEKIIVGTDIGIINLAIFVAENKNYFQEEGLDVEIKEYQSGKLALLAMLKGEDVTVSSVATTPIMFNTFDRQDFQIIAIHTNSYNNIQLVARKDKGISSASDLKGKKIGTPKGSSPHFFLSTFLIYNGISLSEIEIVDIAPTNLLDALANNRVDAISIFEPYPCLAMQLLSNKTILLPNQKIYQEMMTFVAMKDFIKNHPQTLQKFLRAINKANKFIKENKEEAQLMVAQKLKLDEAIVRVLFPEYTYELFLSQGLLINLEDQAKWAIKNNLTDVKEIPNYLDYIYIDALEEVKPEAVTIIR